ncbi:MAG: lamin tail domain-containing protein [Pirellulales bacterium]
MTARAGAVLVLSLLAASVSQAQIRITEWEYNGAGSSTAGEYFELMNVGTTAINMGGWSFDDSSRTAGSFSLSAFGTVQPKEIVILTEATEADFRAKWSLLPASIKVIGGNTQNLSRADEINIYDDGNVLVDRLTYDDQTPAGMPSIRTNGISGNPITLAALGANDKFQWKLSVVGDSYGSYMSTEGNLGNPGIFSLIPEPGSLALALLGFLGLGLRRSR